MRSFAAVLVAATLLSSSFAQWAHTYLHYGSEACSDNDPWYVDATNVGVKCTESDCSSYVTPYGTFHSMTECLDSPKIPSQKGVTYELYLDSECSDDSFGSFLWFKSGCQFLYWTSCDNKVVDIYQCLDWQNTSCNACSLDLSGTAGQCTTDPSGIWMMMTCTGGDSGLSAGATAAAVICTLLGVALLGAAGYGAWYFYKNKYQYIQLKS